MRTQARRAAIAAGEIRYFSGSACHKGHVAERYTSNGMCSICASEILRARYSADSSRQRARSRAYGAANAQKIKEKRRVYQQTLACKIANRRRMKALRSTPEGRINHRMASRMAACLGGVKSTSWEALLGYTIADLKRHLERQFTKGMSWDNAGQWHIDHILPLASFSFTATDDPEFRAAWAITNLRPFWAIPNMKKHAKREHLL